MTALISPCVISVSGLIGAGKTTLADAIGEELGLKVYHEKVEDNPYLRLFYTDMPGYAFKLQMALLKDRFSQQMELSWSPVGGVQDRSIYEDSVFALQQERSGCLTTMDYHLYVSLHDVMTKLLPRPDVVIHLDISPEKALERIRRRARSMETGISLKYLQELHDAYETKLPEIGKKVRLVRIPYEEDLAVGDSQVELRKLIREKIVPLVSLAM
jgi:deoxyadenosine/deoxycytidine kinase